MSYFKKWIVIVITAYTFRSLQATAQTTYPCPWSWEGYYYGVNLGIIGSSDKFRLDPEGAWNAEPADLRDFIAGNGRTTLSSVGVIVGGQIGYNFVSRGWLMGIEADANYLSLSDKRHTPQRVFPAAFPLTFVYRDRVKHRWLATIRARVGIPCGLFLPYITGGFAASDTHVRSVLNGPAEGFATFPNGFETRSSTTKNLTGWTAGLGLEYAFRPFISCKVEYLYVNLGSFSTHSSAQNAASAGYTEHRSIKVQENCVRVGVNFRFPSC